MLAGGLREILLESAATKARPTRATIASTLDGNSGVVDVTVVVLAVELAAAVVVLAVVEVVVVVLTVVVVEEVLVEAAADEYTNVATCDAVPPFPPQVAFTEKVPDVQPAFPPGYDGQLKLPFVRGETSLMSAMPPAGFLIVMITAVFGPGDGETTPVMPIG